MSRQICRTARPMPCAGRLLHAVRVTCVVVALSFAAGGSAQALETSCRPSYDSTQVQLGPDLEAVKYNGGPTNGTCSRAIRVSSVGPTGTLWGTDWQNNLWRSTDDATSWQLAATVSGYTLIDQVLELRSGSVLLEARDANGRHHLLRSDDGASSFADVFDFPTDEDRILGSQSWVETEQGVFVAEYGGARGLSRALWRSTDDGRSWATAFSTLGIRHFHSVQADPYAPGRLWVTAGDSGTEPRIGYSDDAAAHITWITLGTYPLSRTVALMFTRDAVFWATDVPEVPSVLGKWSRATGLASTVATGLDGPYRVTVASGDVLASFSGIEPPYGSDQYVRVMTSNGGGLWAENDSPWRRVQDSTHTSAAPFSVTAPDEDGYFWVWYQNLERSYAGITNIKLRIIDHTPPEAFIQSGPSGSVKSDSATFNFSSLGEASAFECRLDRAAWARCESPITVAGLDEGDHSFDVRGRDRAGNVDPLPASTLWTVRSAPVAALDGSASRVLTGQAERLDASGSRAAEGRAIVRYQWDLDGDGSFETDTGSASSVDHVYSHPGAAHMTVRVTDSAGRAAEAGRTVVVTPAPPPGPVGVSIDSGREVTASRTVTLALAWPAFADRVLVADDSGFRDSREMPVEALVPWQMTGRDPGVVYVRFLGAGADDQTFTDGIVLDEAPPLILSATRVAGILRVSATDATTRVVGLQMRSGAAWRAFRDRIRTSRDLKRVRVRDTAGNVSRWHRVGHTRTRPARTGKR
jgi:hypothetical protein